MSNATTEAILDNVHAALPGVADDVANLALFNVCDDLAREALHIVAAPAGIDADPATWLPADQWVPNYQALLAGTLAALYGQFGKPYFSADLAKYNLDKYLAYRALSRTTDAAAAVHIDSAHERLISSIRAQIPLCRIETIVLEMFAAVSCIAVDGFNLPPLAADSAPPDWLTSAQYEQAYDAVLTGTLYRIYGQAGMPWYSEPGYQANYTRYELELHKVRSEVAGSTPQIDTLRERLVSLIRAQVPNITDEAIELTMFDAVNQLRVDAYRMPALSSDAPPGDWLVAAQYEQSYLAITAGMLAGIYAQPAMPWSSPDLAAVYTTRFQGELHKVRAAVAGESGSLTAFPRRLTAAARAQIPAVTDEAIQLALLDVVNQVLADAYRLPTVAAPDTDPDEWMTAAQYQQSYRALIAGLMAALYAQAAMPWANAELSAPQAARFQVELHKVRTIVAGTLPEIDAIRERLVAEIRSQVPDVTDEAIDLTMFAVVNQLRVDAYRQPPLHSHTPPQDWLVIGQYEQSYLAIVAGMLSAIYAQPAMAWSSPELSATYAARFQGELHKVRAQIAGLGDNQDSYPERLIAVTRMQVPVATDEAIRQALLDAVNQLKIDAYRLPPLDASHTNPVDWMTAAQYQKSYQALTALMLAGLYAQPSMPWANAELSTVYAARATRELHKVRAAIAGTFAQTDVIRERLVADIRAQVTDITDEAINLTMFAVVNQLRLDAYRQPALAASTPANDWLVVSQYEQSYLAITAGMLAAIYAQSAMPWSNPELSASYTARFANELHKVRAIVAGVDDNLDSFPKRIAAIVRTQIPVATDEAIEAALLNIVNRVRADSYRLEPLQAQETDPDVWLTGVQYRRSYNALIAGTLAELYGQSAMPWFNHEQFIANEVKYLQEANHLRVGEAGTAVATDTIPERIVSAVRAQIQVVRDESVKLAMFNIVNKLRREVYSLPGLTGADTDYTTWLTVAQYEQSYLAVLYGTLAQLYGQSNMPWYNQEQYLAHNLLFAQELDLARSENIETAGPSGSVADDILEEARTYLPGARDEVMEFELRRALDEFLKFTSIWQEDVKFSARPNRKVYELYPVAKAEIVRVIAVHNSITGIGAGPFSMQNIAVLKLQYEPSAPAPYAATCVLSILTAKRVAGDNCGCGANWGVPAWILERWDEVLLNGLLWRMMMQQGKSYTNTELGVFHGQRWRAGLADARGATRQQNVYDGQTWRFPAFA